MNSAVIIETVAGVGIAIVIAVIAVQLVSSAHAADEHLVRATEIEPTRAARTVTSTSSTATNDAAEQIFTQLQNYYAANIKQGNTIFWATLLAIGIGFGIIFVGVIAAGANNTIAIVAALAGVLSQFIGATFLVALRSTQTQATTYAQTLVELRLRDVARATDARAIDLGLELLREISSDPANPANATKASIAVGLIVKQAATSSESLIRIEPPAAGGANVDPRTRTATITFDDTVATKRH